MECGIKYCYIRNARHQFHAGIDSHQVCRIVQRTEVSALLDNFDYFVIDDNRVCDLHSAVQNAVSDGIYFFQALDDAALLVTRASRTIWIASTCVGIAASVTSFSPFFGS